MSVKTIVITGDSSGIGKASTEKLLSLGYKVIGISRSHLSCTHPNYMSYSYDLSCIEGIKKLAKILIDLKVDGLICNAGFGHFGSLEQLNEDTMQALMNVNFYSHALLCKYLVPYFKSKDHADIIFIGSEAALKGQKNASIYCASKFALRGFAQALKEECRKSHVKVSMIQPGMTRTPFYDNLHFAPGEKEVNALDPGDIAKFVAMVLSMQTSVLCEEIILSPLKKVIAKQALIESTCEI